MLISKRLSASALTVRNDHTPSNATITVRTASAMAVRGQRPRDAGSARRSSFGAVTASSI